ncbi:MAG: hypothetical protein L3J47_00390 [Sulfurovum sp.]|nr:hypothetical protein [Sulfurovum sp.]
MATPIILSSGTFSGAGVAGEGRNDLSIGETVGLADTEVINVGASYVWAFQDIPIGSTTVMINATTATPNFVPDITGSYRLICTVGGTDTAVEVLAVPLLISAGRIPSFSEELEYDEGGNTKGWHYSMSLWMRSVDGQLASPVVSLDQAYNNGSSITADSGAVTITNPSVDAANVLELATTALATGAALSITNVGDGPAISISNGQILAPNGSNSLNAFAFTASPNSGMFHGGAHRIVIGSNGSSSAHFIANQIRVSSISGSGSVRQLASQGDTNTGFFWGNSANPDVLGVSTGGSEAIQWDASQNTIIPQTSRLILDTDLDTYITANGNDDSIAFITGGSTRLTVTSSIVSCIPAFSLKVGSATAPGLRNNSDADTGVFFPAVGEMAVTNAGVETVRWTSSQNQINAGTITSTGIILGGNTVSDILISSDGASSSDAAAVTAGWVTANANILTLDAAYDSGGAGLGRAITADSGAVTITNPNADAANVLELTTTALGTGSALSITNAGDGPAISISNGQILGDGSTTAALPAYGITGSAGLGMRRGAGNTLSFCVTSVDRMSLTAGNLRLATTGSEGSPAFGVGNSLISGLWEPVPEAIAISTNASEVVRWTTSQNQINAGNINPAAGGTLSIGENSLRWGDMYADDIVVTTSITTGSLTAGGDLDAAGGFRRTMAPNRYTADGTSTGTLTADGLFVDSLGWFVFARPGSVVELTAWAEGDVTAGSVEFFVEKSTDGGDTFSALWGTSGTGAVSMSSGGSAEVASNTVVKDTNIFAQDDVLRIRAAGTGYTGGVVYSMLTVEC